MALKMLASKRAGLKAASPARSAVKVQAVARPNSDKLALLATTSALLAAAPVHAEDVPAVDTAVEATVSAVKTAGEFVKTTIDVVGAGVELVKEGYEVVAPVVQQGYEAVAPVVKDAVSAAAPVVKASVPVLEDALKQTSKALENSGLSLSNVAKTTTGVAKTVEEGVDAATPVVNKVVNFVSTTDVVTLGEYALGAAALLYLTPALLAGLGGSLRGYAGELTAPSVLDSLGSDGSLVLIDIRTAKEKEASGIPDVPGSAGGKVIEVEYAVTEDKKLRSQLRDASGIEAQITALQIASLKRVNKGSKIVLMDRNGSAAKSIAKELGSRGFGKVFVLQGGFDAGWVRNKLQVKPVPGTLAPLPASVKTTTTRKSLPPPKAA